MMLSYRPGCVVCVYVCARCVVVVVVVVVVCVVVWGDGAVCMYGGWVCVWGAQGFRCPVYPIKCNDKNESVVGDNN